MDPKTILRKTILGQEIIKSRKNELDQKLRKLLIFVNGTLNLEEMHQTLSKMSSYEGHENLLASLGELKEMGYITDANERITKISSEYGLSKWTDEQALEVKNKLVLVVTEVLGKDAHKVIKNIDNAPNTKEGVVIAVDKGEKLVRLFIDKEKAEVLSKQCHAVLAGFK